jgi:hypothetical protein
MSAGSIASQMRSGVERSSEERLGRPIMPGPPAWRISPPAWRVSPPAPGSLLQKQRLVRTAPQQQPPAAAATDFNRRGRVLRRIRIGTLTLRRGMDLNKFRRRRGRPQPPLPGKERCLHDLLLPAPSRRRLPAVSLRLNNRLPLLPRRWTWLIHPGQYAGGNFSNKMGFIYRSQTFHRCCFTVCGTPEACARRLRSSIALGF